MFFHRDKLYLKKRYLFLNKYCVTCHAKNFKTIYLISNRHFSVYDIKGVEDSTLCQHILKSLLFLCVLSTSYQFTRKNFRTKLINLKLIIVKKVIYLTFCLNLEVLNFFFFFKGNSTETIETQSHLKKK